MNLITRVLGAGGRSLPKSAKYSLGFANSSISYPHATQVKIQPNVISSDSSLGFQTSGDLIIPNDGILVMGAFIRYSTTVSVTEGLRFFKNGGAEVGIQYFPQSTLTIPFSPFIMSVNRGDKVWMTLRQDGGSTVTLSIQSYVYAVLL